MQTELKYKITDEIEIKGKIILCIKPLETITTKQAEKYFLDGWSIMLDKESYYCKEISRNRCGSFGIIPLHERTIYLYLEKI